MILELGLLHFTLSNQQISLVVNLLLNISDQWCLHYCAVPELKEELSQSCEAIVSHMQDFEEHAVVQLYGCAVFAAMTADCKSTALIYHPNSLTVIV